MKTEDRFLLSCLPKMIRNAKINFYTGEVVIEYEVEKFFHIDPPKNKEHEWVYKAYR